MDCIQVVDPVGIAGGLAVLWKQDLNVRLIRRSSFFIEVVIINDVTGREWHLINLYANSIDRVRKEQWAELKRHRQQTVGDWVLWGDFNDLLWDDEKRGGRQREVWALRAFREFVTDMEAIDLGFSGYPVTWVNRRFGNGLIQERLDRVLVSPGWRMKYDKAQVKHLFAVGSDHAALLLDTDPPNYMGHRHFRFDSRWTTDSESYEVVKRGWNMQSKGSKMFQLFQKIKNCRYELRSWSKGKKFNARKKINETQAQLQAIREGCVPGEPHQIRALEKELGVAWEQEEAFWRQKTRANWMVKGDRNTSFFHAKVTQRRRRNTISGIQKADGEWCEEPEMVAKEFGVRLNGQGEDKWTALGMFATFCWHIWLARNEWIFKGVRVDEARIHAKAMDDFSSYVLELSKIGAAAIDTRTEESRIGWVPPAVGVLKVNVDGAFDAKSGRGGVGLVLRDYRGDILEAQAIPILQSSSAESVEALGVRFALFAAVKDMSKDYIVEGDVQTVLKMLQGTLNVKASVEVVIKDSINLAKYELDQIDAKETRGELPPLICL
ncbi:hypothetical protein Vadar_019991 [Vaccinium darrowii]|uniref:Uncharacterized protein n=1 Tax=Vaccinium darrowii TaxID=229202 RepID=A0ACB7Y1P2_9ERIC|nr:hypothetical protein Vadar_019991 [Vaccinium darrowii]